MLFRMTRRTSIGLCALALLALAPWRPLAAETRAIPVLFTPWKASPPLTGQEKTLRNLLAARLVASGRFVEAVGAETEAMVQECVRAVNREQNAESCWVRIGQGQGAEQLLTAELEGDAASCTLVLRFIVLETRVTTGMSFRKVQPCQEAELLAAVDEEATKLLAPLASAPPEGKTEGKTPGPGAGGGAGDGPGAGGGAGAAAGEGGTASTVKPHAVLWEQQGFAGGSYTVEGRRKLPRSLKERASSLKTHGAGWFAFYSGSDFDHSMLMVRGGLALPNLRLIPKENKYLVGGSHWAEEIESAEILPDQGQLPACPELPCTIVDRPNGGYRCTAQGPESFTW